MATEKVSTSIDTIKEQISNYGNEIQKYLESVDASIEDYKFSVAKSSKGGFVIEVALKVSINPKDN